MAEAPRPGAREEQAALTAPVTLRIRLQDKTLDVSTGITLKEKMAVRYATGMPFDVFYGGEDRFGEDSIGVLWWLARRQNGEPNLAFDQAAAEWPVGLSADDIELSEITDDEETDLPESGGPGS